MILFQVRDLAAKSCGEPHVAPSWEIAKASLGAMLSKTPELAERAHSILIEFVSYWDPTEGVVYRDVGSDLPLESECRGDVCLSDFRAACAKEENDVQAVADRPHFYHKNVVTGELDEIPLTSEERNHQIMLEHAEKEEDDE